MFCKATYTHSSCMRARTHDLSLQDTHLLPLLPKVPNPWKSSPSSSASSTLDILKLQQIILFPKRQKVGKE